MRPSLTLQWLGMLSLLFVCKLNLRRLKHADLCPNQDRSKQITKVTFCSQAYSCVMFIGDCRCRRQLQELPAQCSAEQSSVIYTLIIVANKSVNMCRAVAR